MTDKRDDSVPNDLVEREPSRRTDQFLLHFAQDHERILAHIFALLPNEQDAQDVFQRTSLVLWRKFNQFDSNRDFLPWACGVAHYEVRNFLRIAGRDRLRFNDSVLTKLSDERLERREQSERRVEALTACIEKLSSRDRTLIQQAYSGEQTMKQLAERIGYAVQTVYNRLNSIRRGLVECVERSLAEQGSQL